jgi:hypothetical protein
MNCFLNFENSVPSVRTGTEISGTEIRRFLLWKRTDRFLKFGNRNFIGTEEPTRSVRVEPNAQAYWHNPKHHLSCSQKKEAPPQCCSQHQPTPLAPPPRWHGPTTKVTPDWQRWWRRSRWLAVVRVFSYRSVHLYRCGAVRVYRSGINGIPLLTARIQIPNQNRLLKRYRAVYHGINGFYRGIKGFYRAVNNLYRCTEKDPPA